MTHVCRRRGYIWTSIICHHLGANTLKMQCEGIYDPFPNPFHLFSQGNTVAVFIKGRCSYFTSSQQCCGCNSM